MKNKKYQFLFFVTVFPGLLLVSDFARSQNPVLKGTFSPAVIAGEWNWVSGQELHISTDGTSTTWLNGRKINSGKWECTDWQKQQYIFRLAEGGFVDKVVLSKDFNSLTGSNNRGNPIQGTRKVPYSPAFEPSVIAGKWNWVSGQELHINADGTSTTWLNGRKINSGKWECTDRQTQRYVFRLAEGGFIDNVVLSKDFNFLTGTNNRGNPIQGSRKVPYSAFEPSVIAGKWNWVSGQELHINGDGTTTTWLNGRQINSGRWECTDSKQRHYIFRLKDGGYVDNVDLSSDFNTLTGTNNQGFSLRGTRKN